MLTLKNKLILASQSQRRHDLLQQIGLEFTSITPNVDETYHGEEPKAFARQIAIKKAKAVSQNGHAQSLVLAADTIVVIEGEVLGKPKDVNDFLAMMQKLSGNTHQVYTGVCITHEKFEKTILVQSDVSFCTISVQEAYQYWDTHEPIDKAGGYGIQGFGAIFVQNIKGSYSNIVGLPIFEIYHLLKEAEQTIF